MNFKLKEELKNAVRKYKKRQYNNKNYKTQESNRKKIYYKTNKEYIVKRNS